MYLEMLQQKEQQPPVKKHQQLYLVPYCMLCREVFYALCPQQQVHEIFYADNPSSNNSHNTPKVSSSTAANLPRYSLTFRTLLTVRILIQRLSGSCVLKRTKVEGLVRLSLYDEINS
jgi:hypothetical protein